METKCWGWNPKKKKISKIYSLTKDCKFWAGLLLRNVAYLLSFIAPGYRLAITHRWSSPNSGNSRTFTGDIDFFIDLLISETADKACPWKLAMFSHSVFKLLVLQTRKNQSLFGKGLRVFHVGVAVFSSYMRRLQL